MGWKPTVGINASRAGATQETDSLEMEDLTIPQLISFLQSSFRRTDFEVAERILQSRQESLKSEIERNFSEELTLKEVEKIELAARCDALDRALEEEKEKHASLAAKFGELEREKSVAREEADNYKSACERLEVQMARLKEDRDVMCERMQRAEEETGRFLEAQKDRQVVREKPVELDECTERKAQYEINDWKRKCEELEARVLWLEEGKGSKQILTKLEVGSGRNEGLTKLEVGSRRNEGSVVQSSREPVLGGIIEISDSEDDINVDANTHKSSKTMRIDPKNVGRVEDDDSNCSKNFLSTPTPKRKCISRIVTSDSEEEDVEDRIPLSKLKLRKLGDVVEGNEGSTGSLLNCSFGCNDIQEDVNPARRRLVLLRERDETEGGARGTSPRDAILKNRSPIETNKMTLRSRANVCQKLVFSDTENAEEDKVHGQKTVEDDNGGSESDSESLGGFIVSDSDGLEGESSSNDSSEDQEVEEQSDSDVDLGDVLAKIRREKDTKKWEYEADMLSSFSNDSQLCMKAVCALYRQQTCEEQSAKLSMVANSRGFNKLDAERGSTIAVFLMDGDPNGPLKKTVQELQAYDPRALDYCYKLATRYSKQLFTIYQNKEDRFFLPS